MTNDPDWATMPSAVQAAAGDDYPKLLRLARTAAGLTLAQAGQLTGYSPSTLSRLETGHRRTCDARELRRLAQIYKIPEHLMGLSPPSEAVGPNSLTAVPDDGGDPMRRRDLLASGVLAAAGALATPLAPVAAAASLTETLEAALAGQLKVEPLADNQLAAQIAAAQADLYACRYARLANRLPNLLARTVSAQDLASPNSTALAAGRVAQVYNLATDLLTKLHDGMAWATSDRAVHAAQGSHDPVIAAETTRLAAIVRRQTHRRPGAQIMVLEAAQQLQAATHLATPDQAALYAQLLATAAYTAAVNDDRDSAVNFLQEGASAQGRASGISSRFTTLDLAVYRISVARALGDYGTAVATAKLIDPSQITSPLRRARYWEDTALSLHGRRRPEATYRALLTAEKDTPEEVRYRPWAQQLARDLVATDNRNALPGIRDFAQRIGAHA